MSNAIRDGSKVYALATGSLAAERLELQNRLLSEQSQEHLFKAGLSEGKVVFDVGCGTGMMTTAIAKAVGETGHVYAIDISKEQLALAETQIKSENLENVTFIAEDLSAEDNLPQGIADIVYARFFLMHLKNPEKAIEKMKTLLKPGGVIASQECTMSTWYSPIETKIFKEYTNTIFSLGKHYGVDYDIGERLKDLYQDQGFERVEVHYHQSKINSKDALKMTILGLSEWKNKAIEAKVTTTEQVELWEETFKTLSSNTQPFDFDMTRQAYVLAWKNSAE